MFDKINEQLEASTKPVNELASLSMATLQDLAEKQSALFSTLLSSSVSFVETAGKQKDVMSLAEAQKAYLESLQATLTDSAKEAYALVTGAQEKASEVIKGASEEVASKLKVAV